MHPRTVAALKVLEQAHWFAAVGVRNTDAAVVLPTWEEAIERCGSADWENLLLEAANQYLERLAERDRSRLARWTGTVEEIKPAATALVRRKIEAVRVAHRLPKVFEDVVQWDVLHLCMEAEYADLSPPRFLHEPGVLVRQRSLPLWLAREFPGGTVDYLLTVPHL